MPQPHRRKWKGHEPTIGRLSCFMWYSCSTAPPEIRYVKSNATARIWEEVVPRKLSLGHAGLTEAERNPHFKKHVSPAKHVQIRSKAVSGGRGRTIPGAVDAAIASIPHIAVRDSPRRILRHGDTQFTSTIFFYKRAITKLPLRDIIFIMKGGTRIIEN